MMNHKYKVWNGTGWVKMEHLTRSEQREATEKGLVEHSEFCPCVVVDTEPPF